MDWAAYAETWPHADASRFVQSRPHRWHVQILGPDTAPAVLLLHGTGGASHSWRAIAPVLAQRYRLIVPDLPGHGFTRLGALQRSSPDLMSHDLAGLTATLGASPAAIIGHSAGGALALNMARLKVLQPQAIVGLNAALENFDGAAGWLFPVMAKALAMNPFVAPTVARMARPTSVERLIGATGSKIDPLGLALYRACISDARHIDGTLTMMAQWSLDTLHRSLPQITVPTLLLAGEGDRAVDPAASRRAAARLPSADYRAFPGLGHLAHEEDPSRVSEQILTFLDSHITGPDP